MRGLGFHTQHDYVRDVRRFAAFLGRLRRRDRPRTSGYQLPQHENPVGPATVNSTVSAPRFLFTLTLSRRDPARTLMIIRNPRKLPDVLSVEEAARPLEAASGLKYNPPLGVA
jgi:integrase/recombinase XerD